MNFLLNTFCWYSKLWFDAIHRFKDTQGSADVICWYSKWQTRGGETEKCMNEVLEPTYHFSIFNTYYKIAILASTQSKGTKITNWL